MRCYLAIFLIALPALSIAHEGGLDSYGCHNETTPATYHCHQGQYAGLSFESREEAVAYFTSQGPNNQQSLTVYTSVGLYRVETVTGSLINLQDTLRAQVWLTGDSNSNVLAKEFSKALGGLLGFPNQHPSPIYTDKFDGPYFVHCTYLDDKCGEGFNASFWDSIFTLAGGIGIGGGGRDQLFTFAVANALPLVTIAGGDRILADTDGLPGETVLISVEATDSDGTIKELGGEFRNADMTPQSISGFPLPGNSSTYSMNFELLFPDGENEITLWVVDDEGVTGSSIYSIKVDAPADFYKYHREDYLPGWNDYDEDCIDTRHEVLAIESLIEPTFDDDGCIVIAGLWKDPYTGEFFTDPADLEIGHLVPLEEAHDSGARFWSQEEKQDFANNLVMADVLVAVDAGANSSKGASDPSLWLPPNEEYHCEYIRDWVAIKNAYELDIDDDELSVIEAILGDEIHHATGVTQKGVYLSGEESNVRFSLGMTRNGGCAFYTEGTAQDLLDIVISITPEEQHIGKRAAVYLLAIAGTQLYAISSAGQLIPIDADPDQLVEFASIEFHETYEFSLYEGYLDAPLELQFFIAFRPEGGELIYTPLPIVLTLQ